MALKNFVLSQGTLGTSENKIKKIDLITTVLTLAACTH